MDDGECGWLCWRIWIFQGMVQVWRGRMVFKYWEYGFLGVCFGPGGWLVGIITKMEKAYAK